MAAEDRVPDRAAPGASGVDVTLIDALGPLTPEERLRWNDRAIATILELRHGFAAAQADHAAGQPGRQRD